MAESLTRLLVVPIASEDDARATAAALADHEFDAVTAVHVVEKGGGAPDKLSVEQAEARGEDAIDAFRETIPDADGRIAYGEDVVETVLDVATDEDASAVAFCPRGGNRVVQFLSGDTALKLVTEAELPVISLPGPEGEDG
jgi:nucleotide-binding universal stress UspA family protein